MSEPVQYTHVPSANILGSVYVKCARCHVVLRPGQPRAVQIDNAGAVRCVTCVYPARPLLAVDPIVRAVAAALGGNAPLVRVYAHAAAPALGTLVDTAHLAIEDAIEASGVVVLADGWRLENAVLRSEVEAARGELARVRAELHDARRALTEASDTVGEIVSRGPIGTLEAAASAGAAS